jgi:two-component system invasion response regulator UvrY
VIRILIADDHPIVRDGLRRMLSSVPDFHVAAEAASGDEVLAAAEATPVDVLVLDVSMPGRPFLEVLQQLGERHPRLRVIVLSAHAEEEYAERALKAGAMGYVTKERSPEDLQDAIRRVHRGARYVSPALAERLAAHFVGERLGPEHGMLSNREFEVLRLIGSGKSVKEIAAGLALSPKTVSTYRARMLEKLDLRTTADLIRYAIQHGLAD